MRALNLFVLLFGLLVSGSAFAQSYPPCTELPEPAWYEAPTTDFDVIYPFDLQRSVPAKALYLAAVCGARPATIWHLVDSGEGAVVEIPDALADSLDAAVPNLPRVDYMYVRGGGRDREVVVFLFTNGYSGPFFTFDRNLAWTRAEVDQAQLFWNELPYVFLRRAAQWLHDVARFDQSYTVHTEAFGGLVEITIFEQTGGRALANPLGSLLAGGTPATDGPKMWIHELGHYNHYSFSGANAIPWVDEFSSISRHNNTILGVPIPFWFGQNYEEANEFDCRSGTGELFGYVSQYARCGEMGATEDFADTVMLALGVTQKLRALGQSHDVNFSMYRDRDCGHDCDSPSSLYNREGEADAAVMGQKIAFFRDNYTYHPWLLQDADGDGFGWQPGAEDADADDTNPVIGLADGAYCASDAECDDQDDCTVDQCTGGGCRHMPVDDDGDGAADAACGGTDCDDADPSIVPGSERSCTSDCGLSGHELCIGGGWSACDAPTTCTCMPGETQTVPCALCGTAVRVCQPDGTWGDAGACEGQGVCEPGTKTEVACGGRQCSGRFIDESRIDTCSPTCQWETGTCELLEPIEAEVCNGVDDDCDNELDEGCAEGLALVSAGSSPFYGGGGGTLQIGTCPAGYALAGVRLTHGVYNVVFASYDIIAGIEPVCRQIGIEFTRLPGGQRQYSVGGTATTTLSGHGRTPSIAADFLCPANQYVFKASIKTGKFVDTLKLRCASFGVDGDRGSYAVTRSAGTWSGEWFGAPVNTTFTCPAGQVVSGIHTRNGDAIDAISFDCSDVAVEVR